MQTTNFKDFLINSDFKDAFSNLSSKVVPSCTKNPSEKNPISRPKGLEELLSELPSHQKFENASKKEHANSILEHLNFLRHISLQIIPLFCQSLQKHLQIGQFKKNTLTVYADSPQSARLARGDKDRIAIQLQSMPEPLSQIHTIKILVNPALKTIPPVVTT